MEIRFRVDWDHFQLDPNHLEYRKSRFFDFSIFLKFSTRKIVENRNFEKIEKFSEYLAHRCWILFFLLKTRRKSKNASLPWLQTDLALCVVWKWSSKYIDFWLVWLVTFKGLKIVTEDIRQKSSSTRVLSIELQVRLKYTLG